ncbi:hypothetical protein Tco_1176986 [Tanacetum coccineum]
MRKTPGEANDTTNNITYHHYQWDNEVEDDAPTNLNNHHSWVISALGTQVDPLARQINYISLNFPNHLHQEWCEFCGGPHTSYHYQTRGILAYENDACNNQYSSYDYQPPHYLPKQSHPHSELIKKELLSNMITPQNDHIISQIEQFNHELLNQQVVIESLKTKIACLSKLITEEPRLSCAKTADYYYSDESDEDEEDIILDEVHIKSSQSTAQIPLSNIPLVSKPILEETSKIPMEIPIKPVVPDSSEKSVHQDNRSFNHFVKKVKEMMLRAYKFVLPGTFATFDFNVDDMVPLIIDKPILNTDNTVVNEYDKLMTIPRLFYFVSSSHEFLYPKKLTKIDSLESFTTGNEDKVFNSGKIINVVVDAVTYKFSRAYNDSKVIRV